MGYNPNLGQLHCYRPQRSCGKVIFSQVSVNHSVQGGLCPSMHHRSRDQGRGVYVQGGLCLGGSLSRGLYPGGLCPGGLCPQGWVSVHRGGSLSTGSGSLSEGVSVRETPGTVTSGRYSSYWNAFLFSMGAELLELSQP